MPHSGVPYHMLWIICAYRNNLGTIRYTGLCFVSSKLSPFENNMQIESLVQWCATLSGIVAAIMVAFNSSPKMAGWGFVIFTLSSILWVLFGTLSDELPLTVQNCVLFLINLVGVYRWLLKPGLGGDAPSEQSS